MKKDEKKDERANLKILPALHRDIKIAAAQRGEEMYRLIEEAWRAYTRHGGSAIANSGNQPQAFGSSSGRNISSKENADSYASELPEITSDDEPWVHKLLQIRHSQKPGLIAALEYSLNEFIWASAAYDELVKHESPLVSGANAGAGGRRGAPHELSGDAGDRAPAIGSGAANVDLDAAIERITKTQRERHKGKKVNRRKAG